MHFRSGVRVKVSESQFITMTLTERTTAAIAWIDAQIAICKAATDGPWNNSGGDIFTSGQPAQHILYVTSANYSHRTNIRNAAFIATSRTGYPAMLEAMKVAIEAIIQIGYYEVDGEMKNDGSFNGRRAEKGLLKILTTIESLK
jgi:hypothetical protein